jgi:FlaG/FlaF family flagellin (archaellin)
MRLLKDRRGISPVITTVIIVAVGITIAIAVALWMTGLVGAFMGYEKVEIRSAFPNPATGGGWNIVIGYINTGSTPTRIDNVFVNNIPYDEWSTITCDPDIAGGDYASANVGESGTITLTLSDPCTYGGQTLTSGVTVMIKLHSTGGKEYFTSVVLP